MTTQSRELEKEPEYIHACGYFQCDGLNAVLEWLDYKSLNTHASLLSVKIMACLLHTAMFGRPVPPISPPCCLTFVVPFPWQGQALNIRIKLKRKTKIFEETSGIIRATPSGDRSSFVKRGTSVSSLNDSNPYWPLSWGPDGASFFAHNGCTIYF